MPLTATFRGPKAQYIALCHPPQVRPPLRHRIPSSPRGHHPQLPSTHPSTTSLLPGLQKLTLPPVSGYFLFWKHQPPSFPSLEQLQLNFLMALFFQNKGWSLFLECSFFIPSIVTPLILPASAQLSLPQGAFSDPSSPCFH